MDKKRYFLKAKPVWAKNLEKEFNITCGFRTDIEKQGKEIRMNVAAATFYKVYINGEFFAYGPARCGHGSYRVDEFDITSVLKNGKNAIAFEVVSYNINSFEALDVPGFLQAEITADNEVLAYTDTSGSFKCFVLDERIQKVQKYSYQRTFSEAYTLDDTYAVWRAGKTDAEKEVKLSRMEKKTFIDRRIPHFFYPEVAPVQKLTEGTFTVGNIPEQYKKDRSLFVNDPKNGRLKGFYEKDLAVHLTDETQEMKFDITTKNEKFQLPIKMTPKTFECYGLKGEKTGFVMLDFTCKSEGIFYFMFDERFTNNDVDPYCMECTNVIKFCVKPGKYSFASFEPYGFKYLKIACLSGEFEFSKVAVSELIYPVEISKKLETDNQKLLAVYDAAIETFKQNSSDIFMDCPTRERAGWLCDSYFTAKTEFALTGKNPVEENFLENFLVSEGFRALPHGMLPMCYPSDHYCGQYIPNWAMWFVIELEDHCRRHNDFKYALPYKKMVYRLLDYFEMYINEFGLLEKLDNWVFVEWSAANGYVQDINYPSNMQYAAMLDSVANMYQDSRLHRQAREIRKVIRKRSFNGEYFMDHETRNADGSLVKHPEHITETCQYYAFYFGVATPESHPELWNKLINEFGPERHQTKAYPEIGFSNAFIGNYLRLDLLNRYGYSKQILKECEGYFYYMAEQTGTLWENMTSYASCNHGFASYAAALLLENIDK